MSQKQGDKDVASLDPVSFHPPASNVVDRGSQVNPASSRDTGTLAGLLRAASEVSSRVNAILDPDELLSTITPLLNEGFGFYYVHIYLLDPQSRTLRLRAGYGEAGRQMLARGHKISLDAVQSLVAQVARTRTPVVVNDVSINEAYLPNSLLPDTRSEMALPMVVGEDVLGVLDVQDDQVDAFTQADQDVLFTLCGQIATALQNARYVEHIAQSLTETKLRLEITQALSEAQTQESVLDTLIAHAALEDVLTVIELFNRESDEPTVRVVRHATSASGIGMPDLDLAARLLADDPSLQEWFAQSEEFVADHVQEDVRVPEELQKPLRVANVGSLLALPLRSGDRWLGLMMAMTREQEGFSAERRLRYRTLAEQGATALQQAQLRDRLNLTQFSVDQAPVAIFWIRPDGALHTVNDTACDLLGYTRSELLSLPAISKLDPNMIPSVWAVHWRKVKQDKRFIIETEYRTKSGLLIPVEVTATYLRYGDAEYNCVYARDVKERKQAELMSDRFTMQLRTAAEISEQVGAILDTDQLLAAVIPLLKERFELYHAHVYRVEGEDLALRAGYGRIGQIMVRQGHKIPLHHPHSLVARAARTREPVLVNDVSQAPDFLPNMLLPKTRSEVAIPIVIGEEVLGVFDVQSDKLAYFTESDLDVFRTLAGQLSNALYSAMLFERQAETQQELRNSVQTVRAIFDAMTEGILVTDMMGRITDLNEAALRLYGFDGRDELLGQSAMDLVTKSGWSRMAESMYQAMESGRGRIQEFTMVRKDGSTFDAERSSALLWDAVGEPQGVVSITRDITEGKRARRQVARLQALAQNAVDAIMMVDFSGRITYANPACNRLFGYEPLSHEMLGQGISGCWDEKGVNVLLEQVLPAAGAGGWQGEALQIRRDGSVFEAALTFFSVIGEKGEPISVASIVRDVSDRKKAESELQRFALQLRTAADVSAQVSTILDPTTLLEAVVPLVQERFGLYHVHVYTLDAEERRLVMRVGSGEPGRILRERGHAIALDQDPSLVAKAARTKEIVLVGDVAQDPAHLANPLLPKTRSEVAIPMLSGSEVIGVLDVQDNTPDRFTESEVDVFSTLAAQIAIAFRNAQYFEEIQATAERLREVDRLKSEFLANMSHELRTPLNSILGYAEVMQLGIDGELPPDMEEDVTAIFENGQQLLQLINDVLDLTKIEAGRMTLSKAPVAVSSLLEEAKAHCLGLLHRQPKPVEISISVDEATPHIMADPMRLAQILNNLLSNAIKFTDEGEIWLKARHNTADNCVRIDVSDTGVGISRENLGHLFERFRQIDGSSTRRAEGTGLGLAITKHLVELHNGSLTVESELGRGSTFTVSLPVGDPGLEASLR